MPMQRVGFGGGCHWCTEAVFQSLRGVEDVSQGFIASLAPDDAWSEAVIVTFNPHSIALEDLIAVHLATHASSSNHAMRAKYRSAVYTFDKEQQAQAEAALEHISQKTDVDFVTRVLPYQRFRHSDEKFRNYYEKGPEKPFCQTYIDPKLATLRKRFSELLIEAA